MNKITLVIISATLCIVILIFGLYVQSDQNAPENPSKTDINIEIADFEIIGWNYTFTFMIINNGTSDINDLNVVFSTNSTYNIDRDISAVINSRTMPDRRSFGMGELYPVGSIKAGEVIHFYGVIFNDLGDSAKVRGFAFTATLQSNDTFLDQATVIIP